jgi:hypothetical protein
MERDPLSLPGTVLENGPSALDIGFKRKAGEALAQDQAAKAKVARQKKFKPYEPKDVFRYHQDQGLDRYNVYLNESQKIYADYAAGRGGDPDDPSTDAFRQMRAMEADMNQYSAGSLQVSEQAKALLDDISNNPGKYRPEYKEAVNEWMYDPRSAMGEIEMPRPDDYFDFETQIKKVLDRVEPDQKSTAFATKDGRNYQKLVKTWSPEKVNEATLAFSSREDVQAAYLRQFENLANTNPGEAARIEIDADRNNRSIVHQMAYETAEPSIATQETSKLTGSGRSWGEMSERSRAKRIVEVTKGIAEQNYEGLSSETSVDDLQSFFTGDVSGDEILVTDVYNDLSLGKDQITLSNGSVKEVPARVRKTVIDTGTGKIKFSFGKDGEGKPIESKWYNKEEFVDNTLGKVQEFNKGFGGIDAYVSEKYNINPEMGYDLNLSKPKRKTAAGIFSPSAPKTAADIFNK